MYELTVYCVTIGHINEIIIIIIVIIDGININTYTLDLNQTVPFVLKWSVFNGGKLANLNNSRFHFYLLFKFLVF